MSTMPNAVNNETEDHEYAALASTGQAFQITCCSWSDNGRLLAVGTSQGFSIFAISPPERSSVSLETATAQENDTPSRLQSFHTRGKARSMTKMLCNRWIAGGVRLLSMTGVSCRLLVVTKTRPNAILIADVVEESELCNPEAEVVLEAPADIVSSKEFDGVVLFIHHTSQLLITANMKGPLERITSTVEYNVFNRSMQKLFTVNAMNAINRSMPLNWSNLIAVGVSKTNALYIVFPNNTDETMHILHSDDISRESPIFLSEFQATPAGGVLLATLDADSMYYAALHKSGRSIFVCCLHSFRHIVSFDVGFSNEEINGGIVTLGIWQLKHDFSILTCITPQQVRIFQIGSHKNLLHCSMRQCSPQFNAKLQSLLSLSSFFLPISMPTVESQRTNSCALGFRFRLAALPMTVGVPFSKETNTVMRTRDFLDAKLDVFDISYNSSKNNWESQCESHHLFNLDIAPSFCFHHNTQLCSSTSRSPLSAE